MFFLIKVIRIFKGVQKASIAHVIKYQKDKITARNKAEAELEDEKQKKLA
jgi:hypothetical protein